MGVNQVERAYRAWPILTEVARKRSTITYGQLGEEIGVHHRAIRYVLGVIQDYCLAEGLPPLTILVVNKSGQPGSGFIAADLGRFEEELEGVCSYKWDRLPNPFEFAADGESYDSVINGLITDPDSADDVYTRVKVRGVQQTVFREAVRRAYGFSCAFTGISMAVDASHIIPWESATQKERMDPRNGILLNSFHHRLFDDGLMTINRDGRIVYYDPYEEDQELSGLERQMTLGLHGTSIDSPKFINRRPLADYIDKHNRLLEWDEETLAV